MDYLTYDRSNNKNDLNQIKVIDNFLPKEEYDNLCHTFLGEKMIWNYQNVVDYEQGDNFMFCHLFWTTNMGLVSPFSDILKFFYNKLKTQIIIRIKANLTTRTETHLESAFHYDNEFAGSRLPDGTLTSYTAIYYVNTNNGYTLFKDGNLKVDSVGNRIVIFDSSKLHKAVSCTDEKRRVVINFNYFTSLYGSKDQTAASIKLFNEANA